MDTSSLKEAGLTDGEIKVYLALLELGSSTSGPITEKSGVSRSIIYQLLDQLTEKGLVGYTIVEKTKYFQASSPNTIIDLLEERKKKLDENKTKIASLIPQLSLLRNLAPSQEVTVFKGFRGLQTAHEHTYEKLKQGEGYFYLGIAPAQPEFVHAYWKRDHLRRIKAGINCQLLFHPDTPRSILANRNSYKKCDARYMPIAFDTPVWFMGYKDVTVIGFASGGPITIEIVNKEIAESFYSFFKQYWEKSRPFS